MTEEEQVRHEYEQVMDRVFDELDEWVESLNAEVSFEGLFEGKGEGDLANEDDDRTMTEDEERWLEREYIPE